MPNIKSAIKRVEVAKARTIKNAAAKSTLRTTIRRFEESLSTDAETAKIALNKATRALDKASSKGLVHQNTASRKKSRLTKRFAKHFAQVG
ncbi:ribosomal protein S20 [Desulfitobacterium dichloroeliminans LMG P-21439]|uniref:Small ribosomal subunit protein bS20 n=1 Tax=Desulfitobacterium dichloroeliminans (strain LMG P-21439 / DCA1) TaxID=871963 RepID=L0FCP3_DESDL|nr:30S ribosomal protein S20 [Desulfitobacterium dichloroeliminans]AGA70426.1 ribosomal protein S20 [Desulfitobacterium dichloroeliminans LMG P-21439]